MGWSYHDGSIFFDNAPTCEYSIRIYNLGLKIKEGKPDITQENLEKFVINNGGYPECLHWDNNKSNKRKGYLTFVRDGDYNSYKFVIGGFYSSQTKNCEIIDSRWTKENLGGGEGE